MSEEGKIEQATPASEAAWEAHCLPREGREVFWTGVAAASLIPAWLAVDVVLEPQLVAWGLPGRLICLAIALACLAAVRGARTVLRLRAYMAFGYVSTAWLLAPLVVRAEHFSVYLGGYSLWFWGVGLGTVWPVRWGLGVMGAMLAGLAVAFATGPAAGLQPVLMSGGYLVSVAAVGTFAMHARRRSMREAFDAGHALAQRNAELQEALENVRTLSGLLPLCAWCRRVRDDQGYWQQIERYLATHAGTEVTHALCPECMEKHFPGDPAGGGGKAPAAGG